MAPHLNDMIYLSGKKKVVMGNTIRYTYNIPIMPEPNLNHKQAFNYYIISILCKALYPLIQQAFIESIVI